MDTREEILLAFGAAKVYVRDLEALRNRAFVRGNAWPQERQAELDEAKAERSRLAREATQVALEARGA